MYGISLNSLFYHVYVWHFIKFSLFAISMYGIFIKFSFLPFLCMAFSLNSLFYHVYVWHFIKFSFFAISMYGISLNSLCFCHFYLWHLIKFSFCLFLSLLLFLSLWHSPLPRNRKEQRENESKRENCIPCHSKKF